MHQCKTRCFGETILLTGHRRLLSLTDFNSKGCVFWSEHTAALKLMGFPALHPKADQTSLVTRRKWIFFLQGSVRLPQAIPSLRLGSWWAEARTARPGAPAGPLCSTWALPQTTQMCFTLRNRAALKAYTGAAAPNQQAVAFLIAVAQTLTNIINARSGLRQSHSVSGESSQISLQPSHYFSRLGRFGEGKKRLQARKKKGKIWSLPCLTFLWDFTILPLGHTFHK